MSTRFCRTRIAPTPSGFLHLGNAYSFALTAALAQGAGARLLLRIDDADAPRVRSGYLDDIFETLERLNIQPDEGPANVADLEAAWSQRHRLPLYQNALLRLAEGGHLFACTCSRRSILAQRSDGAYPGTCLGKGLPLDTPGAAWRVKPAWKEGIPLTGMDSRKSILLLPDDLQHFVVRKRDGMPAYQLTSLIDDGHFGVDAIVRGEDLLPSTAAQLVLATLLEIPAFREVKFLHHRLLPGPDGRKLSKSAGDTSLRELARTEAGLHAIRTVAAEARERAGQVLRQ